MRQMPTAAKLFAALTFAAVAFVAAETFKPTLPPETQWGRFSLVCALIGAFWGWFLMGRRVGAGWGPAIGVGVTVSAVVTASALVLFAVREMLLRSMNRRYSGPMDALEGTFDILLEYGRLLADLRLIGLLVLGGILGGLIAEAAHRRLR